MTLQTKKAFQLHFATTRISKFVSFLYKFVLLQSVFLSIPLLLFFSRFRTLHRPETIAFYFGCSSLEIMIKKNHEPRARPTFSNKQLANFWHYLDKILHAVRGHMKNKNTLKRACAFFILYPMEYQNVSFFQLSKFPIFHPYFTLTKVNNIYIYLSFYLTFCFLITVETTQSLNSN